MPNFHPFGDYAAHLALMAALRPHICTATEPYDHERHGEYSVHEDAMDGTCPHCHMLMPA